VAAALFSIVSLAGPFAGDYADGALEQAVLGGHRAAHRTEIRLAAPL